MATNEINNLGLDTEESGPSQKTSDNKREKPLREEVIADGKVTIYYNSD